MQQGPKVAVIGGGTGSFTVLSGLKRYVREITALVNMADDGGSTGQLRDELGVLPPGDIRQCLVALSDTPKTRDLFNYRFEEGSLRGHAFGNLFLTALEKMTGSFAEAVEIASQVLAIRGRVEPITLTSVTLCSRDKAGIAKSQSAIEHRHMRGKPELWLEPAAEINPAARVAIMRADIVVIAPGNLYGSLTPALLVAGVREALQETSAKVLYISNLTTKPGHTDAFKVHDYAAEIERFIGAQVLDYVLYNTAAPTPETMKLYAHEGELGVEIDQEALRRAPYKAIGAPLLASEIHERPSASDPLAFRRTLIRHDPDRVAREIMKLYFA